MAHSSADLVAPGRPTDTAAPIGIVAGGGAIPGFVADRLSNQGLNVHVVMLKDDADPALRSHPHSIHGTAEIGPIVSTLRSAGCRKLVLVGSVKSRPDIGQIRPSMSTLRFALRYLRARMKGDDALLRMVVGLLEDERFSVVGAHELVPDLLAPAGLLAANRVPKSQKTAIGTGIAAALALGRLDAGQAIVSIGERIVALEGAEGTDAMLDRVADLRRLGRLTQRPGGVLVKLCKPGQDPRVDLPTIGVNTVEGARKASLSGIAVHAENTLIHDRSATIAAADAAGLFLCGIDPDRWDGRVDG